MPEFILPDEADHCPHCNAVLREPPDCCDRMRNEHADLERQDRADVVDLARVDESVMDGRWQRDMLAALRHGISLIRRGDIGGGLGVLSGVENLLLHAVPPGIDVVGELPSRVVGPDDVIDLSQLEAE